MIQEQNNTHTGVNLYQVWLEGYRANTDYTYAHRLILGQTTLWQGTDFKDACKNAMKALDWSTSLYNEENNSYWGCRFYDNEEDARKTFG